MLTCFIAGPPHFKNTQVASLKLFFFRSVQIDNPVHDGGFRASDNFFLVIFSDQKHGALPEGELNIQIGDKLPKGQGRREQISNSFNAVNGNQRGLELLNQFIDNFQCLLDAFGSDDTADILVDDRIHKCFAVEERELLLETNNLELGFGNCTQVEDV